MHAVISPMVTSEWCTNSFWAFMFTFMQVAVMWSLNLVALEIENPFGRDANDIDGKKMQEEMNRHLLLLLKPSTERTPHLSCLFDDGESPTQMDRQDRWNHTFKSKGCSSCDDLEAFMPPEHTSDNTCDSPVTKEIEASALAQEHITISLSSLPTTEPQVPGPQSG